MILINIYAAQSGRIRCWKNLLVFRLKLELGNEGKHLPCHYLSFLVNNVRYMMAAEQFGDKTL